MDNNYYLRIVELTGQGQQHCQTVVYNNIYFHNNNVISPIKSEIHIFMWRFKKGTSVGFNMTQSMD